MAWGAKDDGRQAFYNKAVCCAIGPDGSACVVCGSGAVFMFDPDGALRWHGMIPGSALAATREREERVLAEAAARAAARQEQQEIAEARRAAQMDARAIQERAIRDAWSDVVDRLSVARKDITERATEYVRRVPGATVRKSLLGSVHGHAGGIRAVCPTRDDLLMSVCAAINAAEMIAAKINRALTDAGKPFVAVEPNDLLPGYDTLRADRERIGHAGKQTVCA